MVSFVVVLVDILIQPPRQGKRRCVVSPREIRQRVAEAFDRGVGPQDSILEGVRSLGERKE